ncbi:MAG: hypothetical protein K8U57_08945 [Planctomycetes bacterium]|nr:hypothetical protein [Planctomycetota bacterium]
MAVILPDDLQAFLHRRERLRYDTSFCEPGQIELLPLDRITLGEVWIEPRWKSDPQGDPHAGEKGYYFFPAVNLVSEAEGYKPEFILLWLPNEQLYGTWDDEHYKLFVFPGVTWADIAADPRPYLVAQWEGPEPGVEFVPNAAHCFRPDPLHE